MKTSATSILGMAERLFKPLIREKLLNDYDELLKTYWSFTLINKSKPIRSKFRTLKKNISFLLKNLLVTSREKLHGKMRMISWIEKMQLSYWKNGKESKMRCFMPQWS